MNKSTKKPHSRLIDEYDLERISKKSMELTKIINWLIRLIEVDPTINSIEVNEVIDHIKTKKMKLDTKAKEAVDDLVEEAELMANVYLD